jgi:hypothetical protein
MIGGKESLPREVHDGLCQLLAKAARADAPQERLAILTTAPSQWLASATLGRFEIVDLSRITGATGWQSEGDIRSTVIEAARTAGWPDEAITLENRTTLGGKSRLPMVFRADMVLLDANEQPTVAIEIKRAIRDMTTALNQARQAALGLSVPYAMVTDGTVFASAHVRGSGQFHEGFPPPSHFSIDFSTWDLPSSPPSNASEEAIQKPVNIDELSQLIGALGLENYVLDYTIPWGTRPSTEMASLTQYVLTAGTGGRELDLISGLLVLLARIKQVNRLTAVVPRSLIESTSHSGVTPVWWTGSG